jgi:hypothetical protein
MEFVEKSCKSCKSCPKSYQGEQLQINLQSEYGCDGYPPKSYSRVTHLTRPTVSSIVAELMEEGLVEESVKSPPAEANRRRC